MNRTTSPIRRTMALLLTLLATMTVQQVWAQNDYLENQRKATEDIAESIYERLFPEGNDAHQNGEYGEYDEEKMKRAQESAREISRQQDEHTQDLTKSLISNFHFNSKGDNCEGHHHGPIDQLSHEVFGSYDPLGLDEQAGVIGTIGVGLISTAVSIGLGASIGAAVGGSVGGVLGGGIGGAAGAAVGGIGGAVPPPPPPPTAGGTPPPPPPSPGETPPPPPDYPSPEAPEPEYPEEEPEPIEPEEEEEKETEEEEEEETEEEEQEETEEEEEEETEEEEEEETEEEEDEEETEEEDEEETEEEETEEEEEEDEEETEEEEEEESEEEEEQEETEQEESNDEKPSDDSPENPASPDSPEDSPFDDDFEVRDPVTGEMKKYYSAGDGTYFTDNTINADDPNQRYTLDEIREIMQDRAENADVLRQDYIQGRVNAQEQHDQWMEQSQRDLERGYSDEMKEYRDWVTKQEEAQKKQEDLEKLADKYHVKADEKAVKDAIKWEQLMNQIDSNTYRYEGDAWDDKEQYLETVDKTAEVGVNVLANITPGGSHVKNAYTFAKSTLVATSEAIADGKSVSEGLRHVAVGMGEGALGVIQNEADSIADKYGGGWKTEYLVTVGTEGTKEGMKEYYKTGDWNKAFHASVKGVGTKTVEFGVSKGISAGFDTLREGSKDYVDYAKKGLVPDDDKAYNVMSKLNNFLNKDSKFKIGPKVKGVNVRVTDVGNGNAKLVMKQTGVAGIFQGTIDKGKLTEGIVNETLTQTKFGDGEGQNIYEHLGGDTSVALVDFVPETARTMGTLVGKYGRNT